MTRPAWLLEGRGLSKRYGSVHALSDVSVAVGGGQVTCVLGDNGAGKSTFIKVLSGVHPQDEGELLVDGRPVRFGSPGDARAHGIATAFQNLATMPLMSIWRNFFLGAEPTRRFGPLRLLDAATCRRVCRTELAKIGLAVRDPDQTVGTLSGGERQAVAISRALYFGARVLILDEPTSALGVKQTAAVLRFIAAARDRGAGVVFVTHNPQHAYPIGDRFVVLNRGRLMGSWSREQISREELTSAMAGGVEFEELTRPLRSPPPVG
ncbi:MAG TPA: ATP-binding cassette domain-containing protein [Actinophytocola sp.]|uniref:ATP-binding cassette domain-containing protein n=1 Tax=Actinophytocola sp. TaxID=1872138 RepID=UPI002DBA4922|nr:ATP-binding cassette domain-containing protein [Actinophytocola sp.]HEU5474345.1 ATP-binding cassette domain-containing protein [Actinophytocola sp.]